MVGTFVYIYKIKENTQINTPYVYLSSSYTVRTVAKYNQAIVEKGNINATNSNTRPLSFLALCSHSNNKWRR